MNANHVHEVRPPGTSVMTYRAGDPANHPATLIAAYNGWSAAADLIPAVMSATMSPMTAADLIAHVLAHWDEGENTAHGVWNVPITLVTLSGDEVADTFPDLPDHVRSALIAAVDDDLARAEGDDLADWDAATIDAAVVDTYLSFVVGGWQMIVTARAFDDMGDHATAGMLAAGCADAADLIGRDVTRALIDAADDLPDWEV